MRRTELRQEVRKMRFEEGLRRLAGEATDAGGGGAVGV